jgi:hypothetical protein
MLPRNDALEREYRRVTLSSVHRTCSIWIFTRLDVTVQTVSQFRPLKRRVSLVGSAPLDTVTVPVNVTIDNYLAPSSRISPTSYS